MKLIFIFLTILLILTIAFVIVGISLNKHNMKKDKYDLLNYLKKHNELLSITLKENGEDTLIINSEKRFPLASTLKLIIALNFVKCITNQTVSLTEKVQLSELDKFYIKDTDGNAHPSWKKSLNYPYEVSLLEIAKGMMQYSSNACTDFLINKIGLDIINDSLEELQLNHDKITYLTPPILMPGYLSKKQKIAKNILTKMNEQSYQNLSVDLFNKMKNDESNNLKEKTSKMLGEKIQLLITKKMPSSTTKQYSDLMFKLGENLLTIEEKELFSEIVLGNSLKDDKDDYFWYKGGATLFVMTSALYKESHDNTISVSLFIEDDTGGELYWIRNIFNDFVLSIATDVEFRKKVKELAN